MNSQKTSDIASYGVGVVLTVLFLLGGVVGYIISETFAQEAKITHTKVQELILECEEDLPRSVTCEIVAVPEDRENVED